MLLLSNINKLSRFHISIIFLPRVFQRPLVGHCPSFHEKWMFSLMKTGCFHLMQKYQNTYSIGIPKDPSCSPNEVPKKNDCFPQKHAMNFTLALHVRRTGRRALRTEFISFSLPTCKDLRGKWCKIEEFARFWRIQEARNGWVIWLLLISYPPCLGTQRIFLKTSVSNLGRYDMGMTWGMTCGIYVREHALF